MFPFIPVQPGIQGLSNGSPLLRTNGPCKSSSFGDGLNLLTLYSDWGARSLRRQSCARSRSFRSPSLLYCYPPPARARAAVGAQIMAPAIAGSTAASIHLSNATPLFWGSVDFARQIRSPARATAEAGPGARRRLTERAVTERSADPAAVSASGAKTAPRPARPRAGREPEGSQGNWREATDGDPSARGRGDRVKMLFRCTARVRFCHKADMSGQAHDVPLSGDKADI